MKQREKTMPPQALRRLTEAPERLVQLYNAAEADRYRKELATRKAAQKNDGNRSRPQRNRRVCVKFDLGDDESG